MMNRPQSPTPLKNSERWRLLLLVCFLFVLFAIVLSSYFRLQIVDEERWSKEAQKQHYFIIKEPFLRGSFYSNTAIKKNHPQPPLKLVSDVQKFHLYADPISIPESTKLPIAKRLKEFLKEPEVGEVSLVENLSKKSRSRRLAMWLDTPTKEAILQWWMPFARENGIVRNSLYFVADYQRSYPFGKLSGAMLHTVRNCRDESTQQAIPTGGLELYFDQFLSGKAGKRRLMRSPRHSLETGEVIEHPENGADVYLTINHYIQAICEEELERGVLRCGAKEGKAVMIDPMTGEILAMAQYPFFYPPDYQNYFNDKALTVHTQCKSVTEAFEPGSVIKPLTLCAALQANKLLIERKEQPIFDPEAKVATHRGIFPGRKKPLLDTHMHAFLNMSMALQKSSNIYMAQLTEKIVARLGAAWYRDFLFKAFALGKKSGIEFPGEVAGMLPAIGKRYRNNLLEWSAGTPYVLAIGYNLQVNAIQLVRAYSVLANGGFLVDPTLVRKIVKRLPNGDEQILVDNTSKKRIEAFPRVLSKGITEKVVPAMKYTTKVGGTSPRGDVYGYTEAGKSSTSKKISRGAYVDVYRSAFIGFAPAGKPAFVLMVAMDEPTYGFVPGIGKTHHGGINSAPVFRVIAQRTLEYLGTARDDPYGYAAGDPRSDTSKADWHVEAKTLQATYRLWNSGTTGK